MKTRAWLASMTFLVSTVATGLGADETAVVKQDRVNVRGQAALVGEVVTQLRKGETVTVLEEITAAKPKKGEPAKWVRIAMPPNTPVWVQSSFIDPATKTVIPKRLNLRVGPGENHDVVGRLDKGATVKEISTKENWMEVEGPPTAYGFVAAEFLERAMAATPASPPAPVLEEAKPVAAAPVITPPTAAPVEPTPPAPVAVKPAPVVEVPPVVEPAPIIDPAPPKRIVTREGYVTGTVSIQAPSYFELNNVNSGHVMNYLHTTTTNILLKTFKGKRVLVTGEEALDRRWTNTPVLQIETIEEVR